MRKKKAAKAQRPNKRARERVAERRLAHHIARDLQRGDEWFLKAGKAAEDSREQRMAFEMAGNHWYRVCMQICGFGATKWLRLVADALEGRLHGAKFDEAIEKAVIKATRDGARRNERELNIFPFPSEVYEAFKQNVTEQYKQTGKSSRVPVKDALIRRAKILGHRLSERPGRHRKKNATASNHSKTVATTSLRPER